ncbi:hypothetical protein BIV60_14335 [Bacillus sp. MUM 116]|uniref:hypothetical protein n=1 Tax=Bacillus sp. MUM 116 TaxID=1678002 RepID=UPI0008F5F4D3|nr:hypothetical protein [Bacillus sp. MUM 116]OIK13265.1 hypothetical protein BIV60_14335 [Bacillus sp. MUM 116]
MKKVVSYILMLVLFVSILSSPQSAFAKKVNWGNMKVERWQVGKIDVIKPTDIYMVKNNKLVYYKKAKAKSVYRVYGTNNSYKSYHIGSGHFIKTNSKTIKYTKVPDSIIKEVKADYSYAARGFYWGDSKSDVKKIEMAKLITQDKEFLIYKTKRYGYDAKLVYYFSGNELRMVYYKLDLNEDYQTWNEMGYLIDDIAYEVKKAESLPEGDFSTNDIDTLRYMWNLNSRIILLIVDDQKSTTNATVAYYPK